MILNMKTFGQWLLDKLKERGWSNSEFGRRLNRTQPAISKIISGKNKPRPELIINMAHLLDVTPEEVFRRVWLPESAEEDRPTTSEIMEYIDHFTDEERQELLKYVKYLYQRRLHCR